MAIFVNGDFKSIRINVLFFEFTQILIQYRKGSKGSDGGEIGTTVIYAKPREKIGNKNLFPHPTALRLWEYFYL